MDEELLASLAGRITNNRIAHILGGTQVAGAAERIAKYTSKFKNAMQGNKLTVREVQSTSQVAGASHSVASSMENLRRLAEERLGKITLNSGLSYATIAVQRYRRSDGTTGWLILIPGTDGQDDSPFGWEQNLELMSSNANRRRNADSFRMVEEAMRQAGIGKDEPVALVGHSQGGIVAAALASDLKDSYAIDHVVTAGSPVANHPIPPKTWVTSIEIEDELVASLDGGRNPSTEQWLTVRGKVTQTTGVTPPTVNADGRARPARTPVRSSRTTPEHWWPTRRRPRRYPIGSNIIRPRTATPPISARPPWTRTNGISSRSSTANSSTPDTTRGACRMTDGRARTGNTGETAVSRRKREENDMPGRRRHQERGRNEHASVSHQVYGWK